MTFLETNARLNDYNRKIKISLDSEKGIEIEESSKLIGMAELRKGGIG
ncbi:MULTISPECIES: hypothetical protein [Bacillaceae]|nr:MULTISPECIES: hypothetical protein [Bacillaceae]